MSIRGFFVDGEEKKVSVSGIEPCEAGDSGNVLTSDRNGQWQVTPSSCTVIRFAAASGVKADDFVTMSADETVRACNLGDGVVGRVLAVSDGYADVLVKGPVKCDYLSTLGSGWQDVTSQGTKLVAAGDNDEPRKVLVTSNDTTNHTCTAILW